MSDVVGSFVDDIKKGLRCQYELERQVNKRRTDRQTGDETYLCETADKSLILLLSRTVIDDYTLMQKSIKTLPQQRFQNPHPLHSDTQTQ